MFKSGLYAITDNKLIKADRLIESVEQAIIGGAKIIQYRNKNQKEGIEQAQALCRLCQKYNRHFIINDDIALAQQIGADGVHIGKNDAKLEAARAILGEQAIIGVSCYNQLSLAQEAVNAGANYVAFGRFFSSHTKPQAVSCSIKVLQKARQMLKCPIVAIGGITPNNGAKLIAAGADSLAVIQGLFGQANITAAAQAYTQLFKENR
ncbi:hypothetical protein PN36_23420 [Candidatus Thiomargarita nelsonii]|uniref:Thiamine-phosphate synthase n=1 Tax=Candidatus Thiomargarita nelsonii TaxID=1003181 RepID=A0A0A6PI13_9GAMM|nr:hypothetical protein PN36_23420 [Candidatus Thiomargarita nelsonii]